MPKFELSIRVDYDKKIVTVLIYRDDGELVGEVDFSKELWDKMFPSL